MKRRSVREVTISALFIAMGIIIPMVMPRITVGPASFTLGSHVPLFMAMFFSPFMAFLVALGTSLGFFLSATPIIALRALTHVVFAVLGAMYLKRYPEVVESKSKNIFFNGRFQCFNLAIALIHTVLELLVVAIFYSVGSLSEAYYTQGFMFSIVLIMGVGGLVHSFIDFNIAYFVAIKLSKQFELPIFSKAKIFIESFK